MRIPRPDLAALYLCGLVILCLTALAVAHVAIPDVLPYLATAALSAGAGLSLNTPSPSETIRTSTPAAARSTAPAAAPVRLPAQPTAPSSPAGASA